MSAAVFVGRPVLAAIHQTHTAHTDLVLLCQSATNVPDFVVTEGADRRAVLADEGHSNLVRPDPPVP